MFKIGQFSDWCFQDFFTYYLTKTKTKLHTYLDQILGLFLTKRKILKERTLTFSRKLFWINHFTHQTSTIIVSADSAVNIIVFFSSTFYLISQYIQESSLVDKYPWFWLSAGWDDLSNTWNKSLQSVFSSRFFLSGVHKIEKEDKIILIVMSCGETAAVRVCKSDKSFEGRHWGELAVF